MNNLDIISRIDLELAKKNIAKSSFYADCKITSGAFSQWKTGKTNPTKRSLLKIADYLGVSYEYLAYGTEGKIKCPASVSTDEAHKRAVSILEGLTPEEAALVRAYAQGIIANRKSD